MRCKTCFSSSGSSPSCAHTHTCPAHTHAHARTRTFALLVHHPRLDDVDGGRGERRVEAGHHGRHDVQRDALAHEPGVQQRVLRVVVRRNLTRQRVNFSIIADNFVDVATTSAGSPRKRTCVVACE